MTFSFRSPKRRATKPETTFETIEELCQETHLSGEESDNSSVEGRELTQTPLYDDQNDDRLTETEKAERGPIILVNSLIPKSGPLDLSALKGSFEGLTVTQARPPKKSSTDTELNSLHDLCAHEPPSEDYYDHMHGKTTPKKQQQMHRQVFTEKREKEDCTSSYNSVSANSAIKPVNM